MSFWSALWARPDELSPLARYTIANGLLYMAAGAVLYLAPMWLLELAFMTELDPMAAGFVNLLGMAVGFIGWFYVMGGRTGTDSFALGTVVDRLLLPFVLVPIVLADVVPITPLLAFGIGDPLLAIGALVLWKRGQSASP
ncbi:MAG: hypothetical protein ACI8PZ_005576 [Myxococcota bacterium]|jgi:hypothetical protein